MYALRCVYNQCVLYLILMTPSEMGKKGAAARNKKLSAKRRKEIAIKAAKTRWNKLSLRK